MKQFDNSIVVLCIISSQHSRRMLCLILRNRPPTTSRRTAPLPFQCIAPGALVSQQGYQIKIFVLQRIFDLIFDGGDHITVWPKKSVGPAGARHSHVTRDCHQGYQRIFLCSALCLCEQTFRLLSASSSQNFCCCHDCGSSIVLN